MSLVGESSGARFTLGDALEVRLVNVQPELGRLDLVLANLPPGGRRRSGDNRPGRRRYRGREAGRNHRRDRLR